MWLKKKVLKFGDDEWKITRKAYDAILAGNPDGGELLVVDGQEYIVGWTVKDPWGKTLQWGPPVEMKLASGLIQE